VDNIMTQVSKIDRSIKHIQELEELFVKNKPFSYVVETDINSGERATFAKSNEKIIIEAVNIAADVIHNLRAALDQAYWAIASPFVQSPNEQKALQFPFSETAAGLEQAVRNRKADKVSETFFKALVNLWPHGGIGGNELLYLIHKLDSIDKHRFPIPAGNYTKINSEMIRQQVPDFPARVSINGHFGMCRRDLVWKTNPKAIPVKALGIHQGLGSSKFEKEIDVPVDIVFTIAPVFGPRPFVPTLRQFVEAAKNAITVINAAAKAPS
jgi:hypothetical protein